MPDVTPSRHWHDFRRSVAIVGIGFWTLLGAFPLVVLGVWILRGDTLDASTAEILLQFVLSILRDPNREPGVCHTGATDT